MIINSQLENLGLKLKEANGAIIVIDSAARARKIVSDNNMAKDREEVSTKSDLNIELSRDPDAQWLKKGNRAVSKKRYRVEQTFATLKRHF